MLTKPRMLLVYLAAVVLLIVTGIAKLSASIIIAPILFYMVIVVNTLDTRITYLPYRYGWYSVGRIERMYSVLTILYLLVGGMIIWSNVGTKDLSPWFAAQLVPYLFLYFSYMRHVRKGYINLDVNTTEKGKAALKAKADENNP